IYYRITGSPRPMNSGDQSNSASDAQQSSSNITTSDIVLRETYQCNGARFMVGDWGGEDDTGISIVNYLDRPQDIAGVTKTAFETRGVLRQRLATCKQPNTASSKPPANATPSAGGARKPPTNAPTVHLREPY